MNLTEFKEDKLKYLNNQKIKIQTQLSENRKAQEENAIVLREAKEQGDLSENAEFQSASEQAMELALKEQRLIDKLSILESFSLVPNTTISLGSAVRVKALPFETIEGKSTYQYLIVPSALQEIANGLLSENSPVAIAILGKNAGQTVQVQSPVSRFDLTIEEVSL